MEAENHHSYKKGLWTKEEDEILMNYMRVHRIGQWNRIPKMTGLKRGGRSCRLRWMNYLRPNVKRDHFSEEEDDLIIRLHKLLGNRWSLIAGRVPGRTDNQVKNHWNTCLSKKLGLKKGNNKRLTMGSSKTNLMNVKKNLSLPVNSNPTMSPDTLNCVGAFKKEADQSISKHCIGPDLWFPNDVFNIESPNFMEFLDGYFNVDPLGQWL